MTEDAREAEDVDDISTQINDQFREEQGKVTSTQGSYGPYVREYTSWCHDVEQTSAAVTGPKLAKFIQWKRGEKKTEKLPNGQTRKVEYALKTLKTVASAVIHLWEIQRDHPAVYEGNIYKPGTEHPRTKAVQNLLSLHRVRSNFCLSLIKQTNKSLLVSHLASCKCPVFPVLS